MLDDLAELAVIEKSPSVEVMSRSLAGLLDATVRQSAGVGGVFVGRIDHAGDPDATHVYLLGLAEGMYPRRARSDAMISEEERRALDGALETDADRVVWQHRALAAVLAAVGSEA
ncbi:MAG TPA: hypothetical protein DEP69_02155, partial [Acidimicrobiaceae bacterium]|nr:hypothetical protein [Acidimicrobiaceae bacterium]